MDINTRKILHEDKAIELLQGKTITNVFYTEEQGQYHLIPTIELDNQTLLYVQSDDEGNGAGTLHTNIEGVMSLMPQMYKEN
tara:strand:+ start:1049 stop:1294 length:246 start_codon:yes stop_codon:yes gene_type:complete